MDLNFFPEKGRTSSVREKYTQPALRVPEVQGSRATFEFNQALIDILQLTPENYLVFAIEDDRLFATVVPELPEGTKPRALSIGKTDQTTELGRVRKAASKPVATWIHNSLSWLNGEQDLFFTEYQENVYELVNALEAERYEAQAYDAAEEIINEQNVFA
jgi:hypothetical protein